MTLYMQDVRCNEIMPGVDFLLKTLKFEIPDLTVEYIKTWFPPVFEVWKSLESFKFFIVFNLRLLQEYLEKIKNLTTKTKNDSE